LLAWRLGPHGGGRVAYFARVRYVDVQLFFDAIKFLKLHIDQKDPSAYTEDAFIRDIFLQLKQESLPAEF
jgi:hypothetical protein